MKKKLCKKVSKVNKHLAQFVALVLLVFATVGIGTLLVFGISKGIKWRQSRVYVPLHQRHYNLRKDFYQSLLDYCDVESMLKALENSAKISMKNGNYKKANKTMRLHDRVSRGKYGIADCMVDNLKKDNK